jgi:hypothetical protein
MFPVSVQPEYRSSQISQMASRLLFVTVLSCSVLLGFVVASPRAPFGCMNDQTNLACRQTQDCYDPNSSCSCQPVPDSQLNYLESGPYDSMAQCVNENQCCKGYYDCQDQQCVFNLGQGYPTKQRCLESCAPQMLGYVCTGPGTGDDRCQPTMYATQTKDECLQSCQSSPPYSLCVYGCNDWILQICWIGKIGSVSTQCPGSPHFNRTAVRTLTDHAKVLLHKCSHYTQAF